MMNTDYIECPHCKCKRAIFGPAFSDYTSGCFRQRAYCEACNLWGDGTVDSKRLAEMDEPTPLDMDEDFEAPEPTDAQMQELMARSFTAFQQCKDESAYLVVATHVHKQTLKVCIGFDRVIRYARAMVVRPPADYPGKFTPADSIECYALVNAVRGERLPKLVEEMKKDG